MSEHENFTGVLDNLSGYHLHHAHYSLPIETMLTIQSLLESPKEVDYVLKATQIKSILSEGHNAHDILHAICDKAHISIKMLIEDFPGTPLPTPNLILHLWLLTGTTDSVNKVAETLEIDLDWATQLIRHLKSVFTIDNPLVWLQNFHLATEKDKHLYAECKSKLLLGKLQTNQPVDTREERRLKQRNNLGSKFIFKDNN